MFKRFKVTGINENPKKPKRNLMKYLALGCVMALPAFALLKTGVLSMHKNVLAADKNKYDIVADLDGGKFEMGTTPEFTKMDNGNWLYKYKPVPTPTKLPVPVKDGYDFTGWTVSAKPDIQKEYSIPAWHKGNLNVKANWKSKDAILMSGPTFNSTIKQIPGFENVTEIRFVKGTPNQSGVSVAAEGDIKAHISGNILTIASKKEIFANKDCKSMFKTCSSLTNLDLSNFNTSNVTDMGEMFWACSSLTNLDLSNFNTSKVTNMNHMLASLRSITSIVGLENFDTSNVTNMKSMFYYCERLKSLDLSNFNTSRVANMEGMFDICSSLTNLDLSNFNTSNVTNMCAMFSDCKSLTSLDMRNFNTSNLKDTRYMFENCTKLRGSITIMQQYNYSYHTMFTGCSTDPNAKFVVNYTSGCKTIAQTMVNTKSSNSNVVLGGMPSTLVNGSTFNSTINGMSGFKNVEEIRFEQKSGTLSGTDVSEAKDGSIKARISGSILYVEANGEIIANPDCSEMFNSMGNFVGVLNKITFNNFNTSNVKNMKKMFCYCKQVTSLDLSGFDTSNVTNMNHMFDDCWDLSSLKLGNFNTSNVTDMGLMFRACYDLADLDVSTFNTSKVINMQQMFDRCGKLTSIDVSKFDTSGVKNMSYMFADCSSLVNLNVSNFNTSRVTNMRSMFSGYKSSAKLDISALDTSNVTNMSGMFSDYSSTSPLDISTLNTSRVTNMSSMFSGYKSSAKLDISTLDTSRVTNMSGMFSSYSSTSPLDISTLNTSRVTDMSRMFMYYKGTIPLNLNNLDTSKVIDMYEMFYGCPKLNGEITVMNPNTTRYTSMFAGCSTDPNAKFYVKFKDDATKEIARKMVATKSSNSNVFLYETSRLVDGKTFNNIIDLYDAWETGYPLSRLIFRSGDVPANAENVTDVSEAQDGSIKLYTLDSRINQNTKVIPPHNNIYITSNKIIQFNEDCSGMFENIGFSSIYFSNIEKSNIKSMENMFKNSYIYDSNLEVLDLSSVTNMNNMFNGSHAITDYITISNPNITSYADMFKGCSTDQNAKFIVKYTSPETRKVAEKMVATKSPNSHVYLDGTRPAELIKGPTFNSKISGMPGFENVMELRFIKGKPDPNGIDIGTHPGEIKASINGDILTIASEYEIFANPDCSEMFMSFGENTRDPAINCVLNKITFDNFNTSKVVNMYRMFCKCTSLIGLDVSGFNTSNVTNMSYMFDGCSTLTSLNVSNFNTLQVTNMSYMFDECSKLSSLDLSKFSTSKVMNMYKMFTGCSRLTSLNLNNFDTSSVTDMGYMFEKCNSLTSLNLSNFDTSKVNNMRGMFMNCPGISGTIIISNPNITNYTYMFSGCSTYSNAKFTVKYKDAATKEVARKMVATKSSNSNVELYEPPALLVDGAKFNAALKSLVWNDGSRLKVYFMRGNTDNVGSDAIDVSEAQDGSIKIYARKRPKANTDTIIEIVSQSTIKFNSNSSGMFRRVPIWELGLDNIDTSSVTDMSYMFEGCTMLESLDLNNFDMNHVTDMSYMFNRCSDLDGSITISNPNIKSYTQIFTECSTINNSKFIVRYTSPETRKVAKQMVATKSSNSNVILYEPPKPAKLMSGSKFNEKIMPYLSYSVEDPSEKKYVIFEKGDLSNLPSDAIDVSEAQDGSVMMYFNTRRCRSPITMPFGDKEIHIVSDKIIEFNEDCSNMFSLENRSGYRISSIKFNNIDTSKVKNMSNMFSGCNSLISLDLSNFNTSSVYYVIGMFRECSSLTNITGLKDFDMSNIENMVGMFDGCINLNGEITISNPNMIFYNDVFANCSTNSSSKFIVNYKSSCYDIASSMINGGEVIGNVVLGTEVFEPQHSGGANRNISNKEEPSIPYTVTLRSTKPAPTTYAAAHQNMKPAAITRQINITLNNGSMAMYPVQKIQVNSGKIGDLAKPDLNPKYAGQFSGYFYDKNCTIPVKPNDVVTQDIELYAKW